MKKFLLISGLIPLLLFSQTKRPKLVVGIVIDQMRYDYLARFWNKFGDGGFKKLINNGYDCKNMNYNYMPTFTGPGHASIYTGTTPANHGIIANTWYDKKSNGYIYCTQDMLVNSVGTNSVYGKMSPKNLLTTTITDELKLATNNKAKVIGISLKDRAAILPAGHRADAAYWYEGGNSGNWISSTYYIKTLPDWVKKVNQENLDNQLLNTPWNTFLPISEYTESIADNNPYEGVFKGEKTPTFPHNLPTLRDSNDNFDLIKATPFGNTILRNFAEATILGENLGKNDVTDFLTISFSSTDYVGHQFGPSSIEVEDTYIRLDKELAQLLAFIDKNIGKDNVLIFLTADHGAVNVPQFLIDNNLPGGYVNAKEIENYLKTYLKTQYNSDSLILNVSNDQIFLNYDYILNKNWNIALIESDIANFLLTKNGIAKVITAENLKSTEFTDGILGDVQRGYNEVRSGDILYVLESGWISSVFKTGTTHGSPYKYDTHVPLLWYGFGVNTGSSNEAIYTPDIAATIAAILNIQPPSGCMGVPIQSLIKK